MNEKTCSLGVISVILPPLNITSIQMKHLLTIFCLLFSGVALSQDPPATPGTPPDPIEEPPSKRAGSIRPELTIVDNILYVYPYFGEEIFVEILEEGETVWSETSSSDTFILPELREGTEYTLVITINGKSWYGVFTYHEQ